MSLYFPSFAPHVSADIPERERDEVEGWLPQRFVARCDRCGETQAFECRRGQPRSHVNKFGILHLHKDPLGAANFAATKGA